MSRKPLVLVSVILSIISIASLSGCGDDAVYADAAYSADHFTSGQAIATKAEKTFGIKALNCPSFSSNYLDYDDKSWIMSYSALESQTDLKDRHDSTYWKCTFSYDGARQKGILHLDGNKVDVLYSDSGKEYKKIKTSESGKYPDKVTEQTQDR